MALEQGLPCEPWLRCDGFAVTCERHCRGGRFCSHSQLERFQCFVFNLWKDRVMTVQRHVRPVVEEPGGETGMA